MQIKAEALFLIASLVQVACEHCFLIEACKLDTWN